MHSFHQSRGRIFFEVVCALAVSASFAGAWLQTGASAFLPAAFAVGLYGVWHLTDLARRRPAMALDAAPAGDGQGDLLDYIDTAVSPSEALAEAEAAEAIETPEAVAEPEAPPAKPARKPSTRRTKTRKIVEVATLEPSEAQGDEMLEEAAHPHIAPLFEPEPFVRMPRQAFGRRGRI